jgi:hypothetical protein
VVTSYLKKEKRRKITIKIRERIMKRRKQKE